MNWVLLLSSAVDTAFRVENSQLASRMQLPSHVPSMLSKPLTSEESNKLAKAGSTTNDITDLRKSVEYLVDKVDKLELELRNTKQLLHEKSENTF